MQTLLVFQISVRKLTFHVILVDRNLALKQSSLVLT
jgi:hypothetical protein